jgi:predicted DCC family thiol-disulfide oxidoreductase YuxK
MAQAGAVWVLEDDMHWEMMKLLIDHHQQALLDEAAAIHILKHLPHVARRVQLADWLRTLADRLDRPPAAQCAPCG